MRVVGGRPAKVIYANIIIILEDETLRREFGWGQLSFDETLSSLKSLLKPTKTTIGASYQVVGFLYAFMKKKRRVEEGKNVEAHFDEKEEAAEERVIGLSPQNMEDMRQAKNQEKNAGVEDLLPYPLVEEFSKSSLYSQQQGFCGIEVDGDIIYGTKDCGNVNSIINNVISSVFTASSSLPTSPDVKSTQAERSELGGINVDTEDMISDVDGTKKFVNIDSIICNIDISHDEQESSRVSPF
ncbi:hypothetical protein BC332_21220 [Capsicum chinense]|nr:hypothetical protein BC332_21220 [Capsicum chinense]